jgi:DNA-binding GntR family transcriptional regulator
MNLTDTVPAGAAETPRPVQMAEWVAGQLRRQIYAGLLKPGHKLSESALCDSLSVSRNTLREAFAVLAGESLVSRIANRGVFVASPGPDEVREIYRTRRIIESGAICWGELTPSTLASLGSAVEKAHRARLPQPLHRAKRDSGGTNP